MNSLKLIVFFVFFVKITSIYPLEGEIMKACTINQFGGNEVIQYVDDMPIPKPAQDEILVKIRYAAVNPVDWKIRQGYFSSFLARNLPLILGRDFCGEIIKTGSHVTN